MDGDFGVVGSPSGDSGDGVPSDESTTAGSILTGKNNRDMVISVEVSSPFPATFPVVDHNENRELGLGLSIGGNCGNGGGGGGDGGGGDGDDSDDLTLKRALPSQGQYGRILTAKDFPASASSSAKNPNFPIDSSVVGWPPITRGHRLANQTKLLGGQSSSIPEPNKTMKNIISSDTNEGVGNSGCLRVKVNMDGILIGRKVDLNAHSSYETLAQAVEDMFFEKGAEASAGPSKLLDATSEFVLTYEDKDGDSILVGDVPWQMFLSSVKRLRIIRNSVFNEHGDHKRTIMPPMGQERNTRRRTDGI